MIRHVLICEILVNVITLYNICENCTDILVNIYIFYTLNTDNISY